MIVEFPAQARKIYIYWNSFLVSGLSMGPRLINTSGSAYLFEPVSQYVCEIKMNYYEKSILGGLFSGKKSGHMCDELVGGIYKVKHELIEKFMEARKTKLAAKKQLAIKSSFIEEQVSTISGIWHSLLEFDGKTYWDDTKDFPYVMTYDSNPLPSDSRFRKDTIYLIKKDLEMA